MTDEAENNQTSPVAPGRKCGECTLCCKVLSIKALAKPQGVWCEHCHIGVGCQVYANRPEECSRFFCGYLTLAELPEHWRPSRCRIVLVSELDGGRIGAHVDPARPDAWKVGPYYSALKRWAVIAAAQRRQVVVYIGKRAIVILPDREVDLGVVSDDELIVTQETRTVAGVRLDAQKIKRDDPRAAPLTRTE